LKQNSYEADVELIKELKKRSQPISCREGRLLFKQGSAPTGLHILKSGEANLLLESTTGKTVMCLRAGAGCLLGLPAIIGNEPYSMTAIVRKSAEVRFVTRADFEDAMQANPSLYPMLLRVLAAEVRTARKRPEFLSITHNCARNPREY
jgi:CRP-like cAMP-binding protein